MYDMLVSFRSSYSFTLIFKIKKMINNQGQAVRTVTPSFCAEVYGWRELPQAGDEVIEVKSMVSLFLCHVLFMCKDTC